MPGGRPNEFKKEYIQKVDEYLELTKDVEEGQILVENGEEKVVTKQKVNLPTIEDFSTFLDVSKVSLYAWGEENPEFMNALSKILKEQQRRLLNKGLNNQYNPTIAKLVLSANHGMREKTDVTSDDKPLPAVTITGMRIIDEAKDE